MTQTNSGSEFKKKMEGNGLSGEEIVHVVAERIAVLNDTIEEQVDHAIAKARKAGGDVNAYAKANPWQFAGLAAALGFLAGFLLRRKS